MKGNFYLDFTQFQNFTNGARKGETGAKMTGTYETDSPHKYSHASDAKALQLTRRKWYDSHLVLSIQFTKSLYVFWFWALTGSWDNNLVILQPGRSLTSAETIFFRYFFPFMRLSQRCSNNPSPSFSTDHHSAPSTQNRTQKCAKKKCVSWGKSLNSPEYIYDEVIFFVPSIFSPSINSRTLP